MTYAELLNILHPFCEAEYALFQQKLILPPKQKILGVRVPTLRKIAKTYVGEVKSLFTFPDEYFEISFLKLAMAAMLPYEEFLSYLDRCVALIDNWALCDMFKAKCLAKHKQEFLPVLEEYFQSGKEFYQRYTLVTLLSFYIEKEYLDVLLNYLKRADTTYYYVHMASAWLTAEIIIKYYDFGVYILQSNMLDKKTHNKSIQKAIESYRLNKEQKEFLNFLKIK